MREIKFRAWDKELNVMDHGNGELTGYNEFEASPASTVYSIINENYPELEWMQYTGLKDKNGKEIYEGDIIIAYNETMDTICKGQIVWDTWECGFCIKGAEPTFIGYYPKLEIIGNIYENPELLTQ